MITADTPVFPNNAVDLIAERAAFLDPDSVDKITILRRPLRESDPVQSIGVFGSQWFPDEESLEMRSIPSGVQEPTLQSYLIAIQAFVKDMDEERGLATHSVLSKMIRSMLYRDEELRLRLRALTVTMQGSTERMMRWGIRSQRFLSNELSGSWLYLSTLEFWIETETV